MSEDILIPVNQIICGDCAEVMSHWPDGCIDLTVTSPPYDNLRDYQGYEFDFEKIARQLYRVTKQGGVVVWVVGDATIDGSETGTSFMQALFFKEIGFNLHDTMVYEKCGCCMPNSKRYLSSFDYMFILSKRTPKTVNLIKDRRNRFRERWGKGRTVRNKDGSFSPRGHRTAEEFGARFNIWRYPVGYGYGSSDKIAFEHPAIFPEALARDHIKSWSNSRMVVLDPMCGSGTTCKIAALQDRNYIGIDVSEKYCEIARKRIKQATAQQRLFKESACG